MQCCDVAIVGGGVVGSALALDLLARGLDVLVLEARKPDYSVHPPEREIALSAGSVRYLQQLGVWSHLVDSGVGDIRHIRVLESGASAMVALDSGGADSLGSVVEMGQLLQPMHIRLEQRLLSPAQLIEWQCDGEGMQVSCQVSGSEATIQTRLLVGADGINSQLRRMAGIGVCGWDHNRFGLVASVSTAHGHRNSAYECFCPQGPLALLPMADGRFSMVWAVAPRRASQLILLDDAGFMDQLTQSLDTSIQQQIGAIETVTPRGAFSLECAIARSFSAPRVALVGNAAHTIHPVAGQGMNLGLRDAIALAQAVADNAQLHDPGHVMVLAQYADTRRKDVMMTAGFTEGLLAAFGTAGGLPKLLRQTGLRWMGQGGGLRRRLVDYATGQAQVAS